MLSEKFWEKANFIFGMFAVGAVFGLAVFAANIEIKDFDLWLHLKMGEVIAQSGHVPDHDVLSCTIAGKPWVNHEWLFQLLLFYVYSFFGFDGMITMQVVVVVLTLMFLLFLGYQRERTLWVAFLLLLVLMVYEFRFTIRPDIFSLFFFTLFIYILSWHIDKNWSVLALFIVQVLWSNFHGFFFWGPLVIFFGLFSEYTKRCVRLPWEWNRVGRLSDEEFRRLKWIFVVVLLACLFNPQGVKGALYPVGIAMTLQSESKIFFDNIIELQKPIASWADVSNPEYGFYKLMILLSFLSFVLNRRRLDIGALMFWGVFLAFSLGAVRNVVYFGFVGYLVCLTNSLSLSMEDILPFRFSERKFVYMTGIFLQIVLVLWIMDYGEKMSMRGYYDFDKYERKSEYRGVSLRSFPDKAADFLVKHQIKGDFLNDFNSGAYLVGRTYPNIRVFIDGRTEVYGSEFFRNYRTLWKEGNAELLEKYLQRYRITGAFLDSHLKGVPVHILRYFWEHKEWVPVYFDYDGLIFLKDIPENQQWIKDLRLDLTKYRPARTDIMRVGSVQVTPYREVNRAFSYEMLDLDDLAIDEAKYALKISPGYVEPYKVLGKVYGKQGDHEKAYENFRIASMINPSDPENRMNMAMALEKLGEYDYSIKQYERLAEDNPGEPKAAYPLAKIYALASKYDKSWEALQRAHKLDPKAQADVLKIADIVFDQKEYPTALKMYLMAAEGQDENGKVHVKLGLTYRAMGDELKAQEELAKGQEAVKNAVGNLIAPEPVAEAPAAPPPAPAPKQ